MVHSGHLTITKQLNWRLQDVFVQIEKMYLSKLLNVFVKGITMRGWLSYSALSGHSLSQNIFTSTAVFVQIVEFICPDY